MVTSGIEVLYKNAIYKILFVYESDFCEIKKVGEALKIELVDTDELKPL
jgi:hypothetical protein